MEDRKEYSIIGQVTIGTDEYRDLIEAVENYKRKASEADSKYWEQYRRASNALEEVGKLKEYKEYVTENCLDSYKLWKIEKEERSCDD